MGGLDPASPQTMSTQWTRPRSSLKTIKLMWGQVEDVITKNRWLKLVDFWPAGPLLRSFRLNMGRRTAMLLRGRLGSTSIDRTSDSFTQRTGKHLSQTKASFHEFLLNKWKFFWPVMIYPIESVSQVFQITDGALTCRTCSLIQSFVSNLNLINFRQGLTFSLASNHLADRTDSEIRTLRSIHWKIIFY